MASSRAFVAREGRGQFGFRRVGKTAIHLALVFLAFLTAYEIRLGFTPQWWLFNPRAQTVIGWALLYTGVAALVELILRSERSSWRFASTREVLTLALGTTVSAAIFLFLMFLASRAFDLPRSTLVLAWLLSLFALVGIRLGWRLRWDRSLLRSLLADRRRGGAALTVVGDIGEAAAYLRHLSAGPDESFNPVAIVARGGRNVGQFIQGVPVVTEIGGLVRHFAELAQRQSARGAILFLADPILGLGLTTADIGQLKGLGYTLLRQANLVDLHSDQVQTLALREMKLEEFLPRAPLSLDTAPIAALVAGKRVLVTGGGGSIGSEVVRQLVALGCSHVTLLDHCEFLLFEMHRELEIAAPDATHCAVLGNVRDAARLHDVFLAERPDIVFHAAALKHVTLVENNPCEGVLTNVLGTWNVAAAARASGARDMIMISTDKAVGPTNIMGATKRLAESLLSAHVGGETRYTVVRFGNVLGSAGSVVPIFKDQIERGGPVTVTDPEVERFFMTIPEAVQLVLHATALRSADSVNQLRKFVLEMGQPVKIIDLARQMIELSGSRLGREIPIQITGLQPGEKLTEVLVDDNEDSSPCIPEIFEVTARGVEKVIDLETVSTLGELANAGHVDAVRDMVNRLLAEVRDNGRPGQPVAEALKSALPGKAGAPHPTPSRTRVVAAMPVANENRSL